MSCLSVITSCIKSFNPLVNYLRNKFHFSEARAKEVMPKHVNFAWDLSRSYIHEPQKNGIHLLYLHVVFTSFLFIICGILI